MPRARTGEEALGPIPRDGGGAAGSPKGKADIPPIARDGAAMGFQILLTKHTMTKEEVKAKMDERRRQSRMASARAIRAIRAGRHADGAVLLRTSTRPDVVVFISPRIGGGWRTTFFQRKEPTGHVEFERFDEAVRSLCGRHGLWGPPHGSADEWTVLGEAERF